MFVRSFRELRNNLKSITLGNFFIRLLLVLAGNKCISYFTKYISQSLKFEVWIEDSIYYLIYFCFLFLGVNWIIEKLESFISSAPSYGLISISKFLFSSKNQKEVFEPIAADWQEEYFEALFKKEIWKSRWINVRYTYAFLAAMWQKSPVGDLIEFISKLAK